MALKRRVFVAGLVFAAPTWAGAQESRKIVVGLVSWWPAFMEKDYVPRLRAGLAALGYAEPQTLELLPTFCGGDPGLVREAAKRLVARHVDVIVVTATPVATIVKEETKVTQTPVVMAPVADPLATGLVQSIAHPGGNLTGMAMVGPDLSGKRLQYLRDIIPDLKSVAFLGSTRDPNGKTFAASLERVATEAGLKLAIRMVDSPADIDDALMAELKQGGCQAVVIQPIFLGQHVKIVEAARRAKLPSTSDFPAFAQAGALFSYGFDDRASMPRAAYFVDRIVKGAKPADLPIELPTAFTLVVNRKAGAELGFTLPPSLLAQAEEVID
jgi:putative ABC transport system substrate-binding protein